MAAQLARDNLIERARAVLKPTTVQDRLFGDVGAALQTEAGNVFTGVCIDTPSWGLCAERSAIAAMVTAGEYRIRRIVAVWQEWREGRGDDVYVLPPWRLCREFMVQVDPSNVGTEVVLGPDDVRLLSELLPLREWPGNPLPPKT